MQQEYISHFIEFTFEYFNKVHLRFFLPLKKNTHNAPKYFEKSAFKGNVTSEIQSSKYQKNGTFLSNFRIWIRVLFLRIHMQLILKIVINIYG